MSEHYHDVGDIRFLTEMGHLLRLSSTHGAVSRGSCPRGRSDPKEIS